MTSGTQVVFSYQDAYFNIHHTISENSEPPYAKLHLHNMYELYCFIDGSGTFTVEGTTYPLESGTIILMRPGEAHSVKIDSSKRYERKAVHFDPGFFCRESDSLSDMLSTFETDETEKCNCFVCGEKTEFYLKLLDEITNPKLVTKKEKLTSIRANLPALLYGLSVSRRENNFVNESTSDRLVWKIIQFIDRNLENDWTLDTLAETLYRDKAYLNRRFRKVMGTSIWDYTIRKRIVCAQREIYRSGNIGDAFKASGFKDYSTFFRNYQRINGAAPSDDAKSREQRDT